MNPLEYYQDQCQKGVIVQDSEQLAALHRLQRVHQQLLQEHKKRFGFRRLFRQPQLIHGIYLWGGVGIGKTFMMDCFYHCLPFKEKLRLHFHHFMQRIHDDLTRHQGQTDPLQVIANQLSKQYLVICFDEFIVSDITDAMILGRLLKALFAKGVCLVTTSNTKPDDLYKNGLQRSQFLPAIALLKQHTEVIYISTQMDYRLRHLKEAGVFYTPLDQKAQDNMEKTFNILTQGHPIETQPIMINGRSIKIKKQSNGVIWFDFLDICSIPRSQHDYLLLAEKYHTIFISNIPVIRENAVDTISLFVSLVDVFYDARIKLVISAAQSVAELYHRGHLILEYARTHSRLLEMQSYDYFSNED